MLNSVLGAQLRLLTLSQAWLHLMWNLRSYPKSNLGIRCCSVTYLAKMVSVLPISRKKAIPIKVASRLKKIRVAW